MSDDGIQESGSQESNPSDSPILPDISSECADLDNENCPWGRKTVLTLDGGGIRGYSSLLILQKIMERIKTIETIETIELEEAHHSSAYYPWGKNGSSDDTFRPCHYFDYIAGTSTGGLSAIMLGRLRMTVPEALASYKKFGNEVFGKPRFWHGRSPLWYPREKYDEKRAERVIRAIIDEQLGHEHAAIDAKFSVDENQTRCIVFSYSQSDSGVFTTFAWRSYNYDTPPTGLDESRGGRDSPVHRLADPEPIYQVARATSAAPTFFLPIRLKGALQHDGAVQANNPSKFVLMEVWHKENYRVPALFLSIGTGIEKKLNVHGGSASRVKAARNVWKADGTKLGRVQSIKSLISMGHNLFKQALDAEEAVTPWREKCLDVHRRGKQGAPTGPIDEWWYRLNAENTGNAIAIDQWVPRKQRGDREAGADTLKAIEKFTNDFLERPDTKADIDRIASVLVRKRRERVKTEHWERFALRVRYRGYKPPTFNHGEDFNTRKDMRTYLQKENIPANGRTQEELNDIMDGIRVVDQSY
ncbi:FabD/lysophospholipase-like protein [Apiospora arundinis]